MYFSRISLRPEAAASVASYVAASAATDHNLLWTLFRDRPDRERDFLYREAGAGTFMVLSERPALDTSAWFRVEQKPFAPEFWAGQRLGVLLRANATASEFRRGRRGRRVDVIGRAIRQARESSPGGVLSRERHEEVVQQAGFDWFQGKAAESGFSADRSEFAVANEEFRRLRHRGAQMTFGVMDISARIAVTDPGKFRQSVIRGFGASKSYGCGLMLLRPVR